MSWPQRTLTLPGGRQLRATYHEGERYWVVHLVDREDRPVAGPVADRCLRDALVDLLEPGDGRWPSWFIAAANDLAARDTPIGRRWACPCCGYLTLVKPPRGTHGICKVCFWEDDSVQLQDLDYEGGANTVSLNQARQNFRMHGVSETCFKASVRPPLPEEQP